MRAEDIVALLKGVRPTGTNRWMALCPTHEDRHRSLSILEVADRTLLHCFAGCKPVDICRALGLRVSDLFSESRYRPDPYIQRWRRAAEILESWRQSELQRCAVDLRTRDIMI